MANQDRSRQQSGEAPALRGATGQQGVGQQGAGQEGGRTGVGMRERGGDRAATSRPEGMPAQRGSFEPSPYGGFASGPFALMRRISDEMDRIFESFGMGAPLARDPWQRGGGPGGAGLATLWSPRIEMCERDGRLLILTDLPGVRKEDVSVEIQNDRVVIQGERKQEQTREARGYYHSEVSYGSFYRDIPLPEGVDTGQAKATFRDGVLEIDLPAPRGRQRGRTLSIEDRTETRPGSTQGESGSSGGAFTG